MTTVGNSPITLAYLKVRRTPTGGYQTTVIYEGLRDALAGYANGIPSGVPWDLDDDGKPQCKLSIYYPYLEVGNNTPEEPENIWELHGNALQKDIYEHPNARALGMDNLSLLKSWVSKVQSADAGVVVNEYDKAIAAFELATGGGSAMTAMDMLFDLVLRGTTSFQVSQYVLRHTRIVGSKTQLTLAFNDVEKIYTPAQVVTEAAIPGTIFFSIQNIPAPTAQYAYTWGWLKQTPTVRQLAGGKFEVANEWWLEQWSNFLYQNKA